MLKALLSAAVLMSAVSSVSAQQWGSGGASAPMRVEASAMPATGSINSSERTRAATASEPVITSGQIARLKAILKLRPEQHPHWAAVEAALSDIARDRTAAVSDIANKLRRLKAMAAPLIRTLDDNQKSDAIAFAQRIGYGQLAASF
jgi:hypothetical protein